MFSTNNHVVVLLKLWFYHLVEFVSSNSFLVVFILITIYLAFKLITFTEVVLVSLVFENLCVY